MLCEAQLANTSFNPPVFYVSVQSLKEMFMGWKKEPSGAQEVYKDLLLLQEET